LGAAFAGVEIALVAIKERNYRADYELALMRFIFQWAHSQFM